jgi:DNA topoisomerase I
MLIIVESPAKAKTISKIVGSKYDVKASVGHIRALSDAKKTTDGRTLEVNGVDIEKDFDPLYVVDDAKKTVVTDLKKLAKANKGKILFATDEDREGEAISWHLAEVLGIKDSSQIERLVFHEITKTAIEKALQHTRPINMDLVEAQKTRQVLDKIVGYKLSPVLWKVMNNYKLSAGRVQTPALHLICEREAEIMAFTPEEFWEVTGSFDPKITKIAREEFSLLAQSEADTMKRPKADLILKLSKIKGVKIPDRIRSQDHLFEVLDDLKVNTHFTVSNVSQKTEKTSTRPPFITSSLQQAASSRLGMTPKITMGLAQKLYEGIDIDGQPTALITYMRTDSVNLSEEAIGTARKYIQAVYPDCLPEKPKYYKSKSRNAQEAHEAIRPTNILLTPDHIKSKVEPRMHKLYELIWKQTVASQMTDEIRERFSFEVQNTRTDIFSGSVAWTTHIGFKILTGEEVVMSSDLKLSVGQDLYLQALFLDQKTTKPPSRYSPASLIKKLEELGIGRPSTYASIISTLQDREYVQTDKNTMQPTTLGMKINNLLSENFTQVTSSELTAKMEDRLDEIARGENTYVQVLDSFWKDFKHQVETKGDELKDNRQKYTSSQTDVTCPTCDSTTELKIGRFGEYYQCLSHKEHIFPKNFKEYNEALILAKEKFAPQLDGRVCEVCNKPLIVRVSKSSLKPYIACSEYMVGNKHTVTDVSYGPCPKCAEDGRVGAEQGRLMMRKGFRSKAFMGCSLDKSVCGYVVKDIKDTPSLVG